MIGLSKGDEVENRKKCVHFKDTREVESTGLRVICWRQPDFLLGSKVFSLTGTTSRTMSWANVLCYLSGSAWRYKRAWSWIKGVVIQQWGA